MWIKIESFEYTQSKKHVGNYRKAILRKITQNTTLWYVPNFTVEV